MQKLKTNLLQSSFSHIYVEKKIKNHPNTIKILEKFKNSVIIEIENYKEIFCRGHQNFFLQKCSPSLILAAKNDNLIYKGAKVCEDFGNKYFYYTSSIMNCIYNCEYCYLQGMYPSANIVVFVNIEDVFKKVEKVLEKHPMYLCISYDTDLLAFEGITSFVASWIKFASMHSNLKIEIRTKSSNIKEIVHIKAIDNVVLAWTLSPLKICKQYENRTPLLETRLNSIKEVIANGWKVRLCFDPIIYIKDWENIYGKFINNVFAIIDAQKVQDISIGVFRVSKDYLKKMRKENPESVILAYPFECKNGVCAYKEEHSKELVNYVVEQTQKYVPKHKIYI